MKKFFLLFALCFLGLTTTQAQLPSGSIAPDFTVTDIDGNTWNLYDLLDQGKTVYLEFSATWCGPCWNYHNSHAFRDLWNAYGPPGTDEAFVMFIEGDANTNHACLYGPAGCVGGTQGDWVTGTPFPIVEDHVLRSQYAVSFYPTIYMICSVDKKIYLAGQQSTAGLWSFRTLKCPALEVATVIENVQNVRCKGTNTGSVNISVSNGTPPYTYDWSNGAHTQDLANIPAGTYTCTVTASNGWTGVTEPITVEEPSAPLTVSVVEQSPVGCSGVFGSITVEGDGGWSGYNYTWSNSQQGAEATGLSAGNYTVTVTDDNNCSKTLTVNMAPPILPTASIAIPPVITCAQQNIQLDGTGSSSGGDYEYQWVALSGGYIVSGATTLTPIVNAAGNYRLQVTNTANNCSAITITIVTANTTQPLADAGSPGTVTCLQPTTVLQGSGSSGSNFSYLWTASNGGSIASGGNTLTPTASASGTYTLQVTNSTNGCTQTSVTLVTGNNTAPSLSAANGTLTCVTDTVTLSTTTNSNNPVFAWTGPGGYVSTLQSPLASVSGTYNVVVTDTLTGCTNTAAANVTVNTNAPGASATGGMLTCVVSSVAINGVSPDSTATFVWTGPNGYTSTAQNPVVSADGQYTLVATSPSNGCTSSANAAVALNNTPPTASAVTPGNLNCNTSQMQLNGTGSSQGSNYFYQWTTANGNIVSGGTTLTPVVDAVGTYNLLVNNASNGCTSTAAASVAQSTPVTAAIGAQTNVSCNGATNGTAAAISGGGNGTYVYAWSNGANTASISDLAAGTYLVTTTDGENCTASASVTITQPDVLAVNASATAQSANGVNDGTATANPTGGTSGYTYSWSNGGATQTIADLAPGNYTVSVTDANNCTSVQTVTVNSFNCALSATISGSNATCFGANNGTAAVSLTGAAEPVTYTWSNGATTQSVSSLTPGTYTVDVMDSNNCPASLNISITEPTQLVANATATHETAAGANDGTATATPTGGIVAYTYAWSNGAATQTINNLAPGNYTVTVSDANGCTSTQTIVVNAFNCAITVQASVANVTCAGAANGSVSIAPNGGTAPFTYLWSNGGTTATISNLPGGTYTASITDANGCFLEAASSVVEPAPYSSWTVETTNPACPNDPTGTATASISGGTSPYSFLWSNGQNNSTANNLATGNYGVTVTDQNGCQSSTSVSITSTDNLPPTVSLQNATLALNSSGVVEVSLSALAAQLADNCGVASSVISPNAFNCSELGQKSVTVTVTDQSGLTATATAVVNVVDNLAPVVTCPASITRCADDDIVEYPSAVAQDNCLGNGGVWKLENGLESGAEFPIGTTTQTYSYTDAGGNIGSCSFQVIILEPIVFEKVTVTNDQNNQGLGAIDIAMGGGTAPYTFKWTKDGQSVGDTEDISGLTEGNYTVVVTDANGCIVSTANIHVSNTVGAKEPTWVKGIRLQPNPTSGLTKIVFNQAISSSLEISVIDATGRVVTTDLSENQSSITLDCSNLPVGLYILRFRTGAEVGVKKLVVNR